MKAKDALGRVDTCYGIIAETADEGSRRHEGIVQQTRHER